MADPSETVRVVVRCRPLSTTEINDQRQTIIHTTPNTNTIHVQRADGPKPFTFDKVYGDDSTQETLYKESASAIVDSVLEGFNGTIFAYGQTGTGKTFTMEGVDEPASLRGIIPRAFAQIFDRISTSGGAATEFLVRASYLEIYNEEVRDLLSKQAVNRLDLREDPTTGVFVEGLTTYVVKTVKECDKLRAFGAQNRHTGATKMNADSSRSHSIYTITVESCETKADGTPSIRVGKLNLVDLAGSERQSKTQATGDRLKEATKINLSLGALGSVIKALVDGKSTHIPYRDSKLTRLLQDSLGGNTKTVMVANIGPADWNLDETMSTLRYANRAKNIKNKPKINEDPKDAMLREYQEEIARLKAELDAAGSAYDIVVDADGNERRVPREVIEVEQIVEREVQREKIIEVEKEVEVERIIEVEKEVGVAPEEVKRMQRELRQQAEREKRLILDEQQRQRAAARELDQQLSKQTEAIHSEREAVVKAQHRLAELQAKLMHGGENLLDTSVRQEQEAARLAEEMAAARRQEEELRAQVEAEEEARLGFEESYASLEAELEGKSKKLAKLKSKYATVQAEIADVQEEANREKESILESIRELSRQLKLKQLIMGAFIPLDELSKIERCSEWDDATEQWRISRLQYAGNPRAKSAGRVSMSPGQSSPLARRTASATNNDPEQRRDARLFDAAASMASVFFTYAVSGDEARASEPTARRLRVGDADS